MPLVVSAGVRVGRVGHGPRREADEQSSGRVRTPRPARLPWAALPPGQRGLKVHEVATYLNTSRRGVWRLVGRGLLRPVRWPGSRTVRFDLADVEALFGENYKA